MMVVGQEAEPLIAAIQNEIVFATLISQQLIGQFHAITQQETPHRIRVILVRHSFTAQHRLHECLCPHLSFITPFHQRVAHVVNHVDMLRCQQNAHGPGTTDFNKGRPHLLDLTGGVEGRCADATNRCFTGTEYAGFFIAEDTNVGVTHGDQCLRDTVESKPLLRFTPDVVGGTGSGQVERKPLRVVLQQQLFRRGGEPVSTQSVLIVGQQKPLTLQRLDHVLFVAGATGEPAQLAGRQLTGQGDQRQ